MKRIGGIPPIVTVLIVIAAMVGSALVAYFMYATASASSRTPVLEISPLYVTGGLQSGASVACSATTTCRLTLTIKNTGTATITIDRVYVYRGDLLVVNATFSSPVVIQPGQSFTHPSPGVSLGTFNEGDPLTVEVRSVGSGGTILLTTRVSLP